MSEPIKKLVGRGKGKMDANSKEAKEFKTWLKANHEAIENQYGLQRGSLYSLSGHESKFDPLAQSWSGATGAFQLITDTARGFGLRVDSEVDERLDPKKAIHAAAKYLQENMKRYNGNITHAIAQWNGGNAAPKFLQQGKSATDYVSPNGTKGELDGFLKGVAKVAKDNGFENIYNDIQINGFKTDPLTAQLKVNVKDPKTIQEQEKKSPDQFSEYQRRIAFQDNTQMAPVRAQSQFMPVFEKNPAPMQTMVSEQSSQSVPANKPTQPSFNTQALVQMAPHLFRIYQSGGSIIQLSGDGKTVEAVLKGRERIYSRPDTKKLMDLAVKAKSDDEFFLLGKFLYDATKKQDSRPPEYVDA